MKIYLASASPRRKEILNLIFENFSVYIPEFNEKEYKKNLNISDPVNLTLKLAVGKGLAAAKELDDRSDKIVISADTIVYFNDKIYGKGENREKSISMLMELNNNKHQVITAVCIIYNNTIIKFTCSTNVYFGNNSIETIEYYVDKYKPFDKAGAYGIQDAGAILVERIEGSYHNVMGLPIREVYRELNKIIKE
ncbi:nucleoside triphosphate pyrophosphatase [Streptobacillus canis]|uniref:nucleoside triphosphate pyrophosphatase n=1 Tax=Streptobacillus canis TaxID=2678686 RepID=UPI0012E1B295|nr:Maf family protein [Streptobacillus canis]